MEHISTLPVQSKPKAQQQSSSSNTSTEIQNSDFKQFFEYDFHSDVNFLNGWRRIPDKDNVDNYIKAKAFYYSREFNAVSVDGYRQWLEDNQLTDKGPPKVSNEESKCQGDKGENQSVQKDIGVTDSEAASENQSVQKGIGATDSESTSVTDDKNSVDKNGESISFGQVIEFIEKGLSLPGIKDLNIEPVNMDPKPSEVQRKKKPWEQES